MTARSHTRTKRNAKARAQQLRVRAARRKGLVANPLTVHPAPVMFGQPKQ